MEEKKEEEVLEVDMMDGNEDGDESDDDEIPDEDDGNVGGDGFLHQTTMSKSMTSRGAILQQSFRSASGIS